MITSQQLNLLTQAARASHAQMHHGSGSDVTISPAARPPTRLPRDRRQKQLPVVVDEVIGVGMMIAVVWMMWFFFVTLVFFYVQAILVSMGVYKEVQGVKEPFRCLRYRIHW